jgi:Zn ribbon nucleic-acid-binding protein
MAEEAVEKTVKLLTQAGLTLWQSDCPHCGEAFGVWQDSADTVRPRYCVKCGGIAIGHSIQHGTGQVLCQRLG